MSTLLSPSCLVEIMGLEPNRIYMRDSIKQKENTGHPQFWECRDQVYRHIEKYGYIHINIPVLTVSIPLGKHGNIQVDARTPCIFCRDRKPYYGMCRCNNRGFLYVEYLEILPEDLEKEWVLKISDGILYQVILRFC